MSGSTRSRKSSLLYHSLQFLFRYLRACPDQGPRGLYLLPDIAHHCSPDLAVPEVIDHACIVFLLPVGNSLQLRVHLSHGLVPELEKVGKKYGI